MENDSSKIDAIIKDNISKIKGLLEKLTQEFKNSLIDPVYLEEMKKILKVIKQHDKFNKK
jgi:hypothetical protein